MSNNHSEESSKETIEHYYLSRVFIELEKSDLIKTSGGIGESDSIGGYAIGILINDIKRKYPGRANLSSRPSEVVWELEEMLPRNFEPRPILMWKLSESGANAVDIIVKAIVKELDPNAKNIN